MGTRGDRDGAMGGFPPAQGSPLPCPDPAAAVIGTRLHAAVAVSCVLMAFYVLAVK